MFIPFLLIGAGFAFLLQNLGLLPINIWDVFWPGVLIILGVVMLLKNDEHYFWREDKKGKIKK